MKIDSLIFDLDGTLWDPSEIVARAQQEAAQNAGIENCFFTQESVRKVCGYPADLVWSLQAPHLNVEQVQSLKRNFPKEFRDCLLRDGVSFYPGVQEGLALLKKSFRLFLVSNCSSDYLQSFFEQSGCQNLFEDFECFGRTGQIKAENIRSVINRNQLRYPIYIGDTAGDQKAARDAGISYFHMRYGFGEPEIECREFSSFSALTESLITLKMNETVPL